MPLIGKGEREGRRKRKTQLWREGRGGGCGRGGGGSGERASGVCLMPPEENGRGSKREGRTDTWGDRIRGRGSDFCLRLKETIRKLSQPKT